MTWLSLVVQTRVRGEMTLALAPCQQHQGLQELEGRTRLRLAYGREREYAEVSPARAAFCWAVHLAPAGIPAPPPQPTRLLLLLL